MEDEMMRLRGGTGKANDKGKTKQTDKQTDSNRHTHTYTITESDTCKVAFVAKAHVHRWDTTMISPLTTVHNIADTISCAMRACLPMCVYVVDVVVVVLNPLPSTCAYC